MNMSFKCGMLDLLDTAMKYQQVCISTLHDKSRKQANPRLFQKAHPSVPTEIPTLKLV